jgi:hypothetical protein
MQSSHKAGRLPADFRVTRGLQNQSLPLEFVSHENPLFRGLHKAGVVQWQNGSFPSFIRGFDSLHPLHISGLFMDKKAAIAVQHVLQAVLLKQAFGPEKGGC